MRRESDTRPHNRTGRGRRDRDRLLTGDPPRAASELSAGAGTDLDNLMMFVADDLRESALSLASIEAHLVAVHRLMREGELEPSQVDTAVGQDIDGRLDALADALGSLQRSLVRLRTALPARPGAVIARIG